MPNAAAAGKDQSEFWRFSLAFYARPHVADACLELQDSAGVDVNVMFYLLFLAINQRQLDTADVARIDARVKAWRELAIVPLRTLRRGLKTGIEPLPVKDTDALRNAVKRIELDAERLQQEWLQQHAPISSVGTQSTSQVAAAQANLASYGSLLNGLPDAPVKILLEAYARHIG
jgi:uncharacterized protein (TIGR02444 family)